MSKLIKPPRFRYTNESLSSIIEGLQINESDNVLSIAGSGDQPFAILEHAGEVLAVDIDTDQINYVARRMEFLKMGYVEKFFNPLPKKIMNRYPEKELLARLTRKYFSRNIEIIRKKLPKLNISVADIYDVKDGVFSKIYLSNAHSKDGENIAHLLKTNGLLLEMTGGYILNFKGLEIHPEFTEKARQHESLSGEPLVPTVYIKV